MALLAARPPVRRRQRSFRVTFAVSLLSVASVAVLVSLPAHSALWLSVASVVAVALCWTGLRIMWTEVLESRRENAADRAAAAAAYRNLFSARAAEHAEFTTAMTERLAQANIAQRELEGLVVQHETRAQRAESRLKSKTEALTETRARVTELEHALAASAGHDESVVDLVSWDEKTAQKARKTARSLKQA